MINFLPMVIQLYLGKISKGKLKNQEKAITALVLREHALEGTGNSQACLTHQSLILLACRAYYFFHFQCLLRLLGRI